MRNKFLLIIFIFILPIFLSFLLYEFRGSFHLKTMNHGEFIQPSLSAQKIGLEGMEEKTWKILYVSNDCNKEIEKTLFALHQLKIALGKDQNRINLFLLKKTKCSLKSPSDFHVQSFTEAQFTRFKNAFSDNDLDPAHSILLIDPIGNIFMYYPADTNKMDILKDLKRVLEVSQIG